MISDLFFTLSVAIGVALAVGQLCHLVRIPRVVGEIFAGVLLGADVLGAISPSSHLALWGEAPNSNPVFSLLGSLGTVLLMFTAGFEIGRQALGDEKKLILKLALGSTILPFAAALLVVPLLNYESLCGVQCNPVALLLMVAIAASVTSIPVITRIFMDLGILRTRFARLVLATATLEDLLLWGVLACAFSIQSSAGESTWGVMIIRVPLFVLVFLFPVVVPRILAMILAFRSRIVFASSQASTDGARESSPVGLLIITCLFCAAMSRRGGVDPSIGAFFAGIGVRAFDHAGVRHAHEHFREIVMAYFAPFYFFLVGLNLDIQRDFVLSQFLIFLSATSVLKVLGAFASARLSGFNVKTAVTFGVCMNARGGPGIVLATTALAAGAISSEFACTLILSAVATSVIAAFWLGVARHDEPLLSRGS